METVSNEKFNDRPLISAGFQIRYPGYSEKFLEIMKILVSHDGIYTPEQVDLGDDEGSRMVSFDVNRLEEMSREWEKLGPVATCILKRSSPVQVQVIMGRSPLHFESTTILVECDYLRERAHLIEFLSIMKELYSLLHPSYGEVLMPDMIKTVSEGDGKSSLGIKLERALPDIYWANFLGARIR